MRKFKIGLLPLYLELYDSFLPEMRTRVESFCQTIVSDMENRGFEVVAGPVCRLKQEFDAAIKSFEEDRVDAIVSLHLAYSPSLESAEVFLKTKLPIIVLDTTPTFAFGPEQDATEILYNHGIHGVQDMCNLLIRSGKPFAIEAGHWEKSDVLDRVALRVREAALSTAMRRSRIGLVGEPFKGMGDFYVPSELLSATIGVEIVHGSAQELSALLPEPDSQEVQSEIAADVARFETGGLDPQSHLRSVQTGIALRRWITQEKLSAITMNFLAFTKASGLPTIPFLEASKAMARGIGYAGEGDVLTAALTAALLSVYPETTFVEMFCPDWENNSIFVSHIGEMNINLLAGKPKLVEATFPFTDVAKPVIAVGRFRPGQAVLANLAPAPGDSYTLIISAITMLDANGKDTMVNTVRGWFRPSMPVAEFLEEYSRAGGTHHSALVYGGAAHEVAGFGKMMKWNVVII